MKLRSPYGLPTFHLLITRKAWGDFPLSSLIINTAQGGQFWVSTGDQFWVVIPNLKEIEEKGRNYRWIRPEVCLRCRGSHLWGHGFVESWFDGYVHALLLRRYICPLCGCVIKLKPQGYFKRFQATIERIRFHIAKRLKSGKWPVGCGSERCRHWLRALKRQTMAHLGIEWMGQLPQAFDRLTEMGKVPVSRSI